MEKQAIPRIDLAMRIFDRLREEPDCSDVREVTISQVHVVNEGTTWRANIADYGNAKQSVADRALERIQGPLMSMFALAD